MSNYFFETKHYCPVCGAQVEPKADGVEKVQRRRAKPLYVHSRCFSELCKKRQERQKEVSACDSTTLTT